MGDLRVYIVDTMDASFAENREALVRSLSPYRAAKLEKFTGSADDAHAGQVKAANYNLCLAAGLVTDIGLKTYGLREKDMSYGFTGRGKPVFLNRPDIRFNISHSGQYAVAVFSQTYDPGIDIERCSRISNRIIYSFFTEGEREMILSQPDEDSRRRMFGRIWTIREAFMKATGMGMATPRDGFETVMKDGRLGIRQSCAEGEFGTCEIMPLGDYCISVVAGPVLAGQEQAGYRV